MKQLTSYLRLLVVTLFVMIRGTALCQESPSYEVATIRASKPGSTNRGVHRTSDRLTIQDFTLRAIMAMAYGVKSNSQIVGGPKWLDDRRFDIQAKVDDAEVAKIRSLSDRAAKEVEYELMLQALLAERFKIVTTRDARSLPVYALVVTKSGSKLTSSLPAVKSDQPVSASQGPASKDQPKLHANYSFSSSNGHMKATTVSMDAFADWLTHVPEMGDRVVLNKTGLMGDYSFEFNWAQDRGAGVPEDATDPGLFTALKDELGLELKSEKSPLDVVVVQAVSEPSLD